MPDSNKDVEVQDRVREPWPEEEEERSGRKARGYLREHPAVMWGLIAAFIVIVIGVFFLWRHYAVLESTDDAQIDGHITPIAARVSGTVAEMHIQDNQMVNEGTLLVQLDPADYQNAVARARAELADVEASAKGAQTSIPVSNISTRNQLRSARATQTAAEREVEAAGARQREAEANFTRVSKDLERLHGLVQKEEISRQQYDAAVANEAAARATVDAARAAVATAESHVAQAQAGVATAQTAPEQLSITRSRFGSAQAAVQKAQSTLNQALLNLQYATVKAPATGIVSKRSVEVGQVVQAGQPMAALVSIHDIYVTANFKETQLREMRPGQAATIHVDAYDRKFRGHIDSIGGATGARFSLLPPENATGNYVKIVQRIPVKIVLEQGEDPEHLLRPGMSVTPTVRVH